MTLFIFLIISIFLSAIQTAIPFLVKRTVVFGVTIPERFIREKKLTVYKKRYALIVFFTSLITLGIYAIWAFTKNPTEELTVLSGTVIQFGIILISMSLYFYFHGRIVQFKKKSMSTEDVNQVQIMDLTIRSKQEMLPWYIFLLPVIVTFGLISYTTIQYGILPEQLPTHWGINGEVDAFTAKTPLSVLSLPFILLIMQFMFLGINISTKRSGIKLSATSMQASSLRQLALRKYTSWFMFLISMLITLLFSFLQLSTIHPAIMSNAGMIAPPFIFLIVVLAGTVFFAVKVGRADKIETEDTVGPITDLDEDSYWRGGLVYFNKNDPSIFVEKRFGVGWTMNFANPIGYLILIVPVILIILFTSL